MVDVPPVIEIHPATRRDVTYIAVNMREHDKREVMGVLPEWMAPGQAGLLVDHATPEGFKWVASYKGDPVCAFGVAPQSDLTPWLWSAWAFGTTRMWRVIPAVSRYSLRVWPRLLIEAGCTRVEVRSSVDHDIAHRWLEGLGAWQEAILSNYGRDGEDYQLWAWLKKDFEQDVHSPALAPTGQPATESVANRVNGAGHPG